LSRENFGKGWALPVFYMENACRWSLLSVGWGIWISRYGQSGIKALVHQQHNYPQQVENFLEERRALPYF
jgi:hypothetical protein